MSMQNYLVREVSAGVFEVTLRLDTTITRTSYKSVRTLLETAFAQAVAQLRDELQLRELQHKLSLGQSLQTYERVRLEQLRGAKAEKLAITAIRKMPDYTPITQTADDIAAEIARLSDPVSEE